MKRLGHSLFSILWPNNKPNMPFSNNYTALRTHILIHLGFLQQKYLKYVLQVLCVEFVNNL